jgi:Uma2 family endonuclease
MIAALEHSPRFTPTEYLAWEDQQALRHEYVDGEIYVMTGGTVNHGEIAMTFGFALKGHLRGGGCRVLSSDVKVEVAGSNSFFYPDISVTCDEKDRTAAQFISYPCLIIEVLSPSTRTYDRGDKFKLYQKLSSLQEYVLVSSTEMELDVFRRIGRNKWELTTYKQGEVVTLTSINFTFAIEQVYEDIIF